MHRGLASGLVGVLFSSLVVMIATPAAAQSESGSGSQSRLFNESTFQGYDAYKGFYAQFGASVGEIDLDGVDVDTGGGFTITGGYRILPWLSGEANFTYLGGGEIDGTNRDIDYFSFTFGPKFYPLAFFDRQPIPEFIQPYGLVAIGGGEYDVESGPDKSTFIARFIFGFDVWFTDHIGTFVEGGYHVADTSRVDGTGLFTIGAQYRF
jgi:hypothetical protein